jgi:predicted nucleic acid-binding protein
MKKSYFVDSNIFLRIFDRDDPKQSDMANDVLSRARRGEIELFCGPPVFFEVAWVLRSVYALANDMILDALEAMLYTPNLRVLDGDSVRDAIELARNAKQSYPDSYIAITARKLNAGIVTFNRKHFSKLGTPLYSFTDKD